MGQKQKTTEWFAAKAKSIYGDKFDYSKSVYTFSSIPIEIGCKIHGSFWQRSDAHFKGVGCPICNKRIGLETFLERARMIHGDKYDYSKVVIDGIEKSLVNIICPTHGEFTQRAKDHINKKHGCQICGKLKSSKSKLKTVEKFIAQAKKIHDNTYDYSKVIYTTNNNKVEIVCSKHGSFWQTPANHIHKTLHQGCPACAGNIRLTTEQFIERAKTIHKDEYDYSLASYVDSKTKITVICKKHGEFPVLPSNHFKGKKCPKCKFRISKPETAWLDSLNIPKEYRQKALLMSSGKRYDVDAYDPRTNTVYEFNGDYWHGNPNMFDKDVWNERANSTFGELYQKTLEKENELRANNFTVISIWEEEFLKICGR
jgi:hypothetical protein